MESADRGPPCAWLAGPAAQPPFPSCRMAGVLRKTVDHRAQTGLRAAGCSAGCMCPACRDASEGGSGQRTKKDSAPPAAPFPSCRRKYGLLRCPPWQPDRTLFASCPSLVSKRLLNYSRPLSLFLARIPYLPRHFTFLPAASLFFPFVPSHCKARPRRRSQTQPKQNETVPWFPACRLYPPPGPIVVITISGGSSSSSSSNASSSLTLRHRHSDARAS